MDMLAQAQAGNIKMAGRLKKCSLLVMVLITACDQSSTVKIPVQVVYRFDDHRYLELTGYNCQGGLTYIDTQKNIRSQIYEINDGYRIFTRTYIHPSERYISIMSWDASGFTISKDYGRTWENARYVPGGGAKRYGDWYPNRDDIESFTVVNDQGFVKTVDGDLYISSRPFDDPRMMPGGEGIPYSETSENGEMRTGVMTNRNSGQSWGKEYISWNAVAGPDSWDIGSRLPKWQNIPNQVPEVKNYSGWDRMQCDPDLGLAAQEQGK